MKKLIVLIVFFSFIATSAAFAHGGKTDASGGHHDYDNVSGLGSYHYHCDGYPPHLHENGICPYGTYYEDEDYEDEYYENEYYKDEYYEDEYYDYENEFYSDSSDSAKNDNKQEDANKFFKNRLLYIPVCGICISIISLIISVITKSMKMDNASKVFSGISTLSFFLSTFGLFLIPILLPLLILNLIFDLPESLKNKFKKNKGEHQ